MKKQVFKFFSVIFFFSLPFIYACSDDDEVVSDPPQVVIDTSVISEDFNYTSHFVSVLGSEMHYVDEGEGANTFLLLHGNPTSSYLWRNIIPHLAQKGRVVVPDLIGQGKSGKPDVDYSFETQYRYLDAFLDEMQLDNVILVLHDWGSALGFHWGDNHKDRVKGVAFFEAMIASYGSMEEWFGPSSGDPSNPSVNDIMTLFRSGVEEDSNPNSAWQAIVVNNMFVENMLPMMVMTRELTEKEMAHYKHPFELEASRKPVWKWPREIPVGGLTADGSTYPHDAVTSYRTWLTTSTIPKLHLYATPGALNLQDRDLPWIETLPNVKVVSFGPGLHFIQEDDPHKIGMEINTWFDENF